MTSEIIWTPCWPSTSVEQVKGRFWLHDAGLNSRDVRVGLPTSLHPKLAYWIRFSNGQLDRVRALKENDTSGGGE